MEIKGKVHLFFEQSGTFKNTFRQLGINAEDYDIQNNFGETDHIIDLFAEIEKAYIDESSLFDSIKEDDLIIAFFPCIYFSCLSQMNMYWDAKNYKRLSIKQKTQKILERSKEREKFWGLAIKMLCVAQERGLRLVMENPWSLNTYLKANFVIPPTIIDKDRSLRGDRFKKETAYFFINCKPTDGETYQPRKKMGLMDAKKSKRAGVCSEDRSMITKEYAMNFVCDFILGKAKKYTQLKLF